MFLQIKVLIIKSKYHLILILVLINLCFNGCIYIEQNPKISDTLTEVSNNNNSNHNKKFIRPSNALEYSHYNLSVIFYPSNSSVTGNLTVIFYNNDPINFTQIPFHLFLSGMNYLSRQGDMKF